MSKQCLKCNKNFSTHWKNPETGLFHNLSNRKFCIECSPFGKHNTLDITNSPNQLGNRFCPKCKETKPINNFYDRRKGVGNSVYCKPCSSAQTLDRQRKLKQDAVEYKGGKCIFCGYKTYFGALEFHHLNPAEKDFSLSTRLISFENAKIELDKCICVCANCHREIHAGLIKMVGEVGIEPT